MSDLPNKLPLRQKVCPPVLRYSDNNSKSSQQPSQPVHLFTRNDVQTFKYGGFAPAFQTDLPSRNDVISLESVRRASPIRGSDPYSRPFIPAKSEEFSLVGSERKLSLDHDLRFYDSARIVRTPSFISSQSTSPQSAQFASSYISSVVQTNAFMRPKNALKKEEQPPPPDEGVADSESESDLEPPAIVRDVTEARSFVIFPSKVETSFDFSMPSASNVVSIGSSESVIKSLQRPLSAMAKSPPSRSDSSTPESSPIKSILKSREGLYSAASGSAIRRKVKLHTTPLTMPSSPAVAEKTKSGKNTVDASPTRHNTTVSSAGEGSVTMDTKTSSPTSVVSSTNRDSTQLTTNTTSVTDSSFATSNSNESRRPSTPRARQLSASSIVKRPQPPSHPSSPQSQVRNPRYTPTKPYDEVKDPKPEPVRDDFANKVTTTITTSAAKPPIHGNTRSKSMISEQRREGDGAPAEGGKGVEKVVEFGKVVRRTVDGSDSSVEEDERLPGDGETSVENSDDDDDDATTEDAATENETEDVVGDDEDDVVDNPDDDVVDFSGDDSDGISMSSSLSMRSGSVSRGRVQSAKSARSSRQGSASSARSRRPVHPGLTQSLFSGTPPTITFVTQDQRVQVLPWEVRKMLKWRLSPITPNIVKSTVARSGFRITKRNYDWIGCWGRHMKAQCFKGIRDYQKINHFPGTFQMGRKDRLWRNLYKLQTTHGKKEFAFFPQTYVLPADLKRLKQVWDESAKLKWIIKPPASARGIGIKVIHKWSQIPKRRPVIVQKYLAKPYLINQSKFDLRIYVYVTSYDPLRIYIFEDGLVRFASQKYSTSMKHLSNKYMHLTNYSINKRNSEYESNTDENLCQGHKWGLKALWGYLQNNGINSKAIWASIKDVCVKCIISAESPINSLIKSSCKRRYTVHELFGFDIFLDEQLKPWIIEVNISPSLHSNSQLDINIKGTMMKDLLNLAGFMVPEKRDVVPGSAPSSDTNLLEPGSDVCIDKRLWQQTLSSDEKAKHTYFVSRAHDDFRSEQQAAILEILTPDDVRILVETLDEDNRRGEFERAFPASNSSKYLPYFEQPRYYNLLLDAWVQKFNKVEQRGVALLETYCHHNVHIAAPTMDPAHKWSPPNQLSTPRTHSAPTRKLPVRESLPIRTSFSKKPTGLKSRVKSSALHTMSMSSFSSQDSSTTASTRASTTTRGSRDAS